MAIPLKRAAPPRKPIAVCRHDTYCDAVQQRFVLSGTAQSRTPPHSGLQSNRRFHLSPPGEKKGSLSPFDRICCKPGGVAGDVNRGTARDAACTNIASLLVPLGADSLTSFMRAAGIDKFGKLHSLQSMLRFATFLRRLCHAGNLIAGV
jgi:hypothetical protein